MNKVLLSKSEPNIAKKVTLLWKIPPKHPTCCSLNRSEVNQVLLTVSDVHARLCWCSAGGLEREQGAKPFPHSVFH